MQNGSSLSLHKTNNSSLLDSNSINNKKSVIAFLAQIPCYEWNGQKVFVLKECCEKVGYQHTTHFKELIKDNTDGIIELETREQIKEFENKNQMNELSFGQSVSHTTLITPNALIEGLQNSNHPIAKQIRKDGTDVYVRYLQGENVNLKEDLGVQQEANPQELNAKIAYILCGGQPDVSNPRHYQILAIACPTLSLPNNSTPANLTPTEFGEIYLNGMKPNKVNKIMEKLGLQYRDNKNKWVITEKGNAYLDYSFSKGRGDSDRIFKEARIRHDKTQELLKIIKTK